MLRFNDFENQSRQFEAVNTSRCKFWARKILKYGQRTRHRYKSGELQTMSSSRPNSLPLMDLFKNFSPVWR